MNQQIERLQKSIEPLRKQIIDHKVYGLIRSMEDLRIFMQYHVYAVWDFMSLLKSLQSQLTCTSVPWFPKGSADTRFLINEIVVGEESDVDENGIRMSHFELYLKAMEQSGANTRPIKAFTDQLQNGETLEAGLSTIETPKEAGDFVRFTFEKIEEQQAHVQAAVFTFGREDLIPGMFYAIVNDLSEKFPEDISTFKYYLERHIEVDGDHHSHLALQMTAQLCGNDAEKWEAAEKATIAALEKRIALWDGVYKKLLRTGHLLSHQSTKMTVESLH